MKFVDIELAGWQEIKGLCIHKHIGISLLIR